MTILRLSVTPAQPKAPPPPPPEPSQGEVKRALRRAWPFLAAWRQAEEDALRAVTLTAGQARLLRALARRKPRSQRALAATLAMDEAQASRTVKRLVDLGLLTRDGATRLAATRFGTALARGMDKREAKARQRVLARIPVEAKAGLVRALGMLPEEE